MSVGHQEDRTTVALRTLSGPRWQRMVPPALVAGGLTAMTLALHLRDPHEQGTWGQCPTLALFGFYCPGCGGLRAVNDLSNLRLLDAASSHLALVLTLPVLAYFFVRWSQGRWTGRSWDPPDRPMFWTGIVVLVAWSVFTILRNTPAGSWLAP
jgi:uncharacterized protein DUF2752